MRERLFIIGSIAVLLALLVGLNAASYVQVEREPELEAKPDRSTYNAGPTGTRALYEYLLESGRQVVRWRDPIAALTDTKHRRPATFVVVGRLRVPYTKEETLKLWQWIAAGGRLVVIDRAPDVDLLPPADDYRLFSAAMTTPGDTRADDLENITAGTKTLVPTQPTLLTRDVEQIAPSRFAGRLKFRLVNAANTSTQDKTQTNARDATDEDETDAEAEPSPTTAPVFNFVDERGAVLADYGHGRGHVTVLSDPFIVANNGIERADNLQLALNLIATGDGLVAFDEYHQGRAATENELAAYFAGTPVLALCGQAVLLVIAIVWTRGRRFARPLPAPRVDRRSKLEFVASMAELQQRARAYDLAIENIYARTRRALARYGGTGQNVPHTEIAARVAARAGLSQTELEALMRECEDAINGASINARQALALISRLRELERTLGIRMRSREIKQVTRL
jgi:Domain of unknown function (DUF4350)